jgi:hypothetical protein
MTFPFLSQRYYSSNKNKLPFTYEDFMEIIKNDLWDFGVPDGNRVGGKFE